MCSQLINIQTLDGTQLFYNQIIVILKLSQRFILHIKFVVSKLLAITLTSVVCLKSQ